MVNAPKPLPADLGEVFSRSTAIAHGVTDRRLRARDLERPFRGTRRSAVPAPPVEFDPSQASPRETKTAKALTAETWKARHRLAVDDYMVVMLDHQFFSGWTAAVLWRLPIPFFQVKDVKHIEVSTFAPLRPPRRPGIKGSQIRPLLATARHHAGKHILDPASVWATLGPRLALPDRVALGDAVIRSPRFPGGLGVATGVRLGTPEELTRLANIKGRPGRRLLLEALPLLRDGAASAPETHLRLAVVDAGLPEPELDVDVYDEQGRFLGCSELAYPELKLALEYEGDHHRTETPQWDRDIEKYRNYTQAGWEVIRVTSSMLYRKRPRLVQEIWEAFLRRGGCV